MPISKYVQIFSTKLLPERMWNERKSELINHLPISDNQPTKDKSDPSVLNIRKIKMNDRQVAGQKVNDLNSTA